MSDKQRFDSGCATVSVLRGVLVLGEDGSGMLFRMNKTGVAIVKEIQ